MTRKPPPPPPEPPTHLSARSQGLWRETMRRRAISPERLTLLQVALEALDRADQSSHLTSCSRTGFSKPFSVASPLSAKSKPLPAASSCTTLLVSICPGSA